MSNCWHLEIYNSRMLECPNPRISGFPGARFAGDEVQGQHVDENGEDGDAGDDEDGNEDDNQDEDGDKDEDVEGFKMTMKMGKDIIMMVNMKMKMNMKMKK